MFEAKGIMRLDDDDVICSKKSVQMCSGGLGVHNGGSHNGANRRAALL